MPTVNVILKNGTTIEIYEANDAEWVTERLSASAPNPAVILMVYLKEPNQQITRGKFRAEEVAGFTIDPR